MARFAGDPEKFVDAIIYVFMLDEEEEDSDPYALADFLGSYAGIDDASVAGTDDPDAALKNVLIVLSASLSPMIPRFLIAEFGDADNIDNIVCDCTELDDVTVGKIRDSLDIIYENVRQFPDGNSVIAVMDYHIYSQIGR